MQNEGNRGGINYTNTQTIILVILRLAVGWHLLYEGIIKTHFFDPTWSSSEYLLDSKGFLAGFFHSLANNPEILQIIDFANAYGLIAIGLGLILGLCTRVAAFSGISLLTVYYIAHPPLAGLTYKMTGDTDFMFVNMVVIEALALAVFTVFPTGRIGLDRYLFRSWTRNY